MSGQAGPWLVLWLRGERAGSWPLTPENVAEANARMRLWLIQRDVTGTEHYSVQGVRRASLPNR